MASIVFGIAAAGANPFAAAGLALAGALIDSYVVGPLLGGDGGTQTQKVGYQPTDSFSGADEGVPLKELYGRHRVTGSVIYASNRREEVEVKEREIGGKKGGGGKGGQTVRTETYTYYRTIAYAICGKLNNGTGLASPLQDGGAIEKIWLDGKLVYDFGVVDPRIELIETYDGHQTTPSSTITTMKARDGVTTPTPAYRGTTYIVIREMVGTDWGNRVPSLKAQVRSDSLSEGTSVGDVISDLAALGGMRSRVNVDACPECFRGYFTSGETSIVDSILEVMRLYGLGAQTYGDEIVFFQRSDMPIETVKRSDFVVELERDGSTIGWPYKIETRDRITLPTAITVKHTDPRKEYQAGNQIQRRDASPSQFNSNAVNLGLTQINEVQVDNERFVLTEQEATQYARSLLANAWNERSRVLFSLTPSFVWVRPGDVLRLPVFENGDETIDVRVTNTSLRPDNVVEVEGVTMTGRGYTVPLPRNDDDDFIDSEAYVPRDLEVVVFDLPNLTSDVQDTPGMGFSLRREDAAVGQFRTGVLYKSETSNGTYLQIGGHTTEGLWGETRTIFSNEKHFSTWDWTTPVRVKHNWATVPPSATEEEVYAGANVFWINGELVGVQNITEIDDTTVELSGMLRGMRATHDSVTNHAPGSSIVLVSTDRYGVASVPRQEVNQIRYFKALAIGGSLGGADVEPEVVLSRNARAPMSVQGTVLRQGTTQAVIDIWPVTRAPVDDWTTQSLAAAETDPLEFKVEILNGSGGFVDVTSLVTITGEAPVQITIPSSVWDGNGFTVSSTDIVFRITRKSAASGDFDGYPLEVLVP